MNFRNYTEDELSGDKNGNDDNQFESFRPDDYDEYGSGNSGDMEDDYGEMSGGGGQDDIKNYQKPQTQ